MKKKYSGQIIFIILFILGMTTTQTIYGQFKIGIFADCQYSDCDSKGVRYYRNSLAKLNECITDFNERPLDFVVGLGDLIDNNFSSFETVNHELEKLDKKVFQVTGNHDFSVDKNNLDKVPKALNLKDTYYTFTHKDWQFIFLDGNKISIHSNNKKTVEQAEKKLAELKENGQPNANDWNGGVGQKQIKWLEKQLKAATKRNLKVAIFCHYPLLPHEAHTLWDSEAVLELIGNYNCVKAWINGHNHAGGYAYENGIHFITMKGMVDTEKENSYSILSFSKREIKIEGFGREIGRTLNFQ